jgi:putative ABC transport system permease protein
MRRLLSDVRYAIRVLFKSPGFAIGAVLTLALGIGITGSVSSLLRALLLRPLPYDQPERLVMVWNRWSDFPKTWLSTQEYRAYGDTGAFSGVALFQPGQANLTSGGEPERIGSALVSPNLFEVFGVRPIHGRTFTASESGSQPADVVLLSEELWRHRFGGNTGILGTSIDVNGIPKTVVGVIPAGFKLPLDYNSQTPSALWMPLDEDLQGAYSVPPRGGDHNYNAVARLSPGVSLEQARTRMRALTDRLTADEVYPREWNFEALLIPIAVDILGPIRIALLVLAGAVGLVLLIACANVANLLLVRGLQRRKEFAVRLALGAAPGQLVRQMLVESTVLAFLGGLVGLWLSYLGIRAILFFRPVEIPRVDEIGMDFEVVAFIVLLSLATALIFGLFPALRFSHPNLQGVLKESGRGSAGPGREGGRFQSLMVILAVALAVVLLMGANLMIRTSWNLSRIDPGFRTDDVLTLGLSPSRAKYSQPELLVGLYERILTSVKSLPGVETVGAVRVLPLAASMGDWGLEIEGYSPPPGQRPRADWQVVTPGYFESMGIPLVKGRFFAPADRRDAQPVIVISKSMASRYWPGQDPIGRRIRISGGDAPPWSTVIGVVGDVHHQGLTADMKQTWYLPQSQFDLSTGFQVYNMTLVVRTARDPASFATSVRSAVHSIDPQLPVSDVRSLQDVVTGAVSGQRFTMFFLVLCSVLALILAAIGVYAVVRFRVASRTREIGLRVALGAQTRQVISWVVSQNMTLVGLGLTLGLCVALAVTRFLSGLLYGVKAQDLTTLLASTLCFGLVALGAIYLPARRAASEDPLIVLREE